MTPLSDWSVAETAFAASTRGSLAGASEREVTSMSIPNIGPEHFDEHGADALVGARRGNPPPALRDEPATDDVLAATGRASTVTHRFGGVRYALTRAQGPTAPHQRQGGEGDSDAHS